MMKSARTLSDASLSVTRLPIPLSVGLGVERVDHAECLVVLAAVGADRVLGQAEDAGRGVDQPLLGVGRIVVVRRDDPLAVLEVTLKGRIWRSPGRSR